MSEFDFAWALELRKDFPGLFCLSPYLADNVEHDASVRSGDFWYALPEGSFVMLESADLSKRCPGYIENGEWKPLPSRPLGPLANKIRLVHGQGPHVGIDPYHQRPGIVFADPYNRHERSVSLREYGKALWVPGHSKRRDEHGEVAIRFRDGYVGQYQPWTVWSVRTEHGKDLLKPTGHSLLGCVPAIRDEGGDLEARIRRSLADWLGIGDIPPRNGTPRNGRPRRWEIVMMRDLPESAGTPCLVVSPTALNESQNDLVVLWCVRYQPGDEGSSTLTPLSESLIINGGRWTVDALGVRGVSKANRGYDYCAPRVFYDRIDPMTCDRVHRRLESLYA